MTRMNKQKETQTQLGEPEVTAEVTASAPQPPAILRVESYSMYEFCTKIQEAILDGYSFDFDSNENFPTAFGTMLTAGLVKR